MSDYRVTHTGSVSLFFDSQVRVIDGFLHVYNENGRLDFIIRNFEAVERVEL